MERTTVSKQFTAIPSAHTSAVALSVHPEMQTSPVTVKVDTLDLQLTLQRYHALCRKSTSYVIARQTPNLSIYLYQSFKDITPRPGAILDLAKMRGYRVARRGGGVSPQAERLAEQVMGGQKSVMSIPGAAAAMLTSRKKKKMAPPDWRLMLVRMGRRRELISGGSRQNKGTVAGYDEARKLVSKDKRLSGFGENAFKKLNKRNVEVYFELMLRERGRKQMAVAWLPAKKAIPKRDMSKPQNVMFSMEGHRTSFPWKGDVKMQTGGDSPYSLMGSTVLATDRYNSVIRRGMDITRMNMEQYINDKMLPKSPKVIPQ